MRSKRYSTDLSDAEWECLKVHLPTPSKRGRPRTHGSRAILDAIFYVLKSGCPWRLLPRDFPPWKTVYDWFRRWRIVVTEELNDPDFRLSSTVRTLASGAGLREEGLERLPWWTYTARYRK